jgi:hypothetical protein
MYVNDSINEDKVREYQAKGFITENEANLIIATPKI